VKALLVNDASLGGHHGSALVTEQIKPLGAECGLVITAGWDWNSTTAVLNSITIPFDVVLINGEGSVHHDSKTAVRISSLAKLLRQKGIPAYLINATVEACSSHVIESLSLLRGCYVRDSASRDVLASYGCQARVVPDLTLSTRMTQRRQSNAGPLLLTDCSDELKTAQLMAIASVWPGVRFVSLRCPPPWPDKGSRARKIAIELKCLASLRAAITPWSLRYGHAIRLRSEFLDTMASARGIISARYHGVCLALLLRQPFLAVEGNIGKSAALLSDVGLDHRIVDLQTLETMSVPPEIPEFTDLEIQKIDAFLSQAQSAARDMFRWIARDSRSPHDV